MQFIRNAGNCSPRKWRHNKNYFLLTQCHVQAKRGIVIKFDNLQRRNTCKFVYFLKKMSSFIFLTFSEHLKIVQAILICIRSTLHLINMFRIDMLHNSYDTSTPENSTCHSIRNYLSQSKAHWMYCIDLIQNQRKRKKQKHQKYDQERKSKVSLLIDFEKLKSYWEFWREISWKWRAFFWIDCFHLKFYLLYYWI